MVCYFLCAKKKKKVVELKIVLCNLDISLHSHHPWKEEPCQENTGGSEISDIIVSWWKSAFSGISHISYLSFIVQCFYLFYEVNIFFVNISMVNFLLIKLFWYEDNLVWSFIFRVKDNSFSKKCNQMFVISTDEIFFLNFNGFSKNVWFFSSTKMIYFLKYIVINTNIMCTPWLL